MQSSQRMGVRPARAHENGDCGADRRPTAATLLAPLLVLTTCLTLLLSGAMSASAQGATGTPAATYDPANASQDVYWEASDGSLHEDAWTPSTGWLTYSITAPGTLASAPTAIYDANDGSQDVYWKGADGSLREDAWKPTTGWLLYTVTGPGVLTSAPTATYDPNDISQDVYWKGADGSLREDAWKPTTGWLLYTDTDPGVVTAAPTVTYDANDNSQDVYWEGPDGSLREDAWKPTTGWLPYTDTDPGVLTSAPAATYDPDNISQDIYWEASDGSLHEIAWTPSTGWQQPYAVTAPGTLDSSPTATYDASNETQDVYWEASDGSLREDAWTLLTGWLPYSAVTPGAPGSQPAPPGAGSTGVSPPPRVPARRTGRRHLRVKFTLRWSWTAGRTRLDGVSFARVPRHTTVTIACHGHGCPHRAISAGYRKLGGVLRSSRAPAYRAGDRLVITLSSPRYVPERVRVNIRDGHIPKVKLL